jgi:hypothetical protein
MADEFVNYLFDQHQGSRHVRREALRAFAEVDAARVDFLRI